MTNKVMEANNVMDLFRTAASTGVSSNPKMLNATADLTNLSSDIAKEVLKVIEANNELKPLVAESIKSHDAMDQLIDRCFDLGSIDVNFLLFEDDDTLDKMIRSQQSKRSRSKGKLMTMENYRTMLIGAIAENLLRIATNKPKSTSGSQSGSAEVELTEEMLAELMEDPDALRRAIRNVQSKKSIAKSKADFDENSPRWQSLLEVEATLKSLRDNGGGYTVKAIEANQKIEELLDGTNVDNMKGAEAKAMLEAIKDMLASK